MTKLQQILSLSERMIKAKVLGFKCVQKTEEKTIDMVMLSLLLSLLELL